MDNEFLINNFTIVNEPKQNFHFRYITDLKSTHGTLKGQQGDHPKIKLLLSENSQLDEMGNKRDFFVLCSLHSFDVNKNISPHLLLLKGINVNEINYKFIFEQMRTGDNQLEYVWELKDYVIVREKNNNFNRSLENKRQELLNLNSPQIFETLAEKLNLNGNRNNINIDCCNVCLGFTIFERNFYYNTYSLYRDTIYSCKIYNGDDLRIYDLCNTKGSVNGGTKVRILIKIDPKLTLNVVMKKIHPDTKETLWSHKITILRNDIFMNAAISFITPAYTGPRGTNEDEIEVHLYVEVEDSTYKSNETKFYYINERSHKRKSETKIEGDVGERGKKSKVLQDTDVSFDCISEQILKSTQIDSGRKRDIRKIIDNVIGNITNPKQDFSFEYLDSMFNETLESKDTIIHLYMKARASSRKNLIVDFRDENRENLLHLACRMNKYWAIRPLISLGCHIYQQNYSGRTPLHIALANKHNDCILEIQKPINDPSKYPEGVENDIKEMLRVYDDDGHTVLHAALLGKYYDLLEDLFIFLIKHNMNILDYEVLGNGDTIAHLAFKNNLNMSLVEKYVPNYKTAENYAGTTVEDLENEMFEKLKI